MEPVAIDFPPVYEWLVSSKGLETGLGGLPDVNPTRPINLVYEYRLLYRAEIAVTT